VLFIGDLSRDKGVHVLLAAYAAIADAPPLVLIGRHCADTPRELPENVHVFHSWPHAAIMEAWRGSMFGVVPSTWPDPCPTVAMEAMACGRAIVASSIGGLTDIVADGETGILVPPGDAFALETALRRLIDGADLRSNMGNAGARRIPMFQAGTVVPMIEQIYKRLVQQKTPVVQTIAG
jgi:glycosyltransferase involved in cell wall biosynthesis